MPMQEQLAQIACKIETTEGADIWGAGTPPGGADIFLASNIKFTPDIKMVTRKQVRGNNSPQTSLPGLRSGKLSFDVEMVGGSSAGHPIGSANSGNNFGLASALIACNVQQTLVVATSGTYAPCSDISTSDPFSNCTVSVAWMMDGKMYKGWGARGNAKMVLNDGEPGKLSIELTLADWSEEDESLVSSSVVYNSQTPPVFQGATFSLDSTYTAIISKLEFDLGCKPALRPDVSASSGYRSAYIAGIREPMVSFDPENVLAATYDFMGKWRAGTIGTLSAQWGSTPSQFTLTFGYLQYEGVSLVEKDGLSRFDIKASPKGSSGDDEWGLVIV